MTHTFLVKLLSQVCPSRENDASYDETYETNLIYVLRDILNVFTHT